MKVIYIIFLLVLSGFSSLVNAALDPAKEMGMLAHKALYDIKLSTKKSSSNISNISGKMFYEWQPSCDAWISNHRFDMLYEYAQSPSVRVTSDFSTYESFDGKSFNFTLQRKRGGMVFEEVRGSANAGEKDYPDEVIYSIPKELVFNLPEGTLFPTAHTLAVLDKIKAGDKFYKATIFDGSDAKGPVDINSLILSNEAAYIPAIGNNKHINKDLIKAKGWNMRLAFFPLNDFEITPDYEMSMVFHENGVISDMDVDYGDFSVTQKLIAIEPLDDACLTDIDKE